MEPLLRKESKYQKTKIGCLPHDWELKKLGDIAEFWNGKAHEQAIDDNGEYIVINSKFVSSDGKTSKFCNELISPLKQKDIAIVMSDIPNGKAIAKCFSVEIDDKYSLNQRIGGIRSTRVVPEFLHYVLNRNSYFLKFDDGVQQTNLRKDDMLNCPVQLPPVDEQESIAEFLKAIDKKIELINNKIAYTQELKKGLLQKLFSLGIGIQDEKANWQPHNKFENGKPSTWLPKRLDELASVERGKFSARPRNDPKYFGGSMPFVQTGNITNSKLYVEEYKQTLNEDGLLVSKTFPVGTILITIAANIGDVAITKFEVACPDSLVGIIAEEEICNYWLYYALQMKKSELDSKATQNAQKNINLQVLNPLTFNVPPLSEQKEISSILLTVDKKLNLLDKQNRQTKLLKKGLMQKLLTGKWRIKAEETFENQTVLEA
ncbi:restriction endonuclease subunit S [Pseudoalteromonas undina]|uniref:Restriction endonuclease subunit S n=1 Tax=Pseudoalteromonas undina TaxID=43660 RepID=A0ACC6R1U0_9GAMM